MKQASYSTGSRKEMVVLNNGAIKPIFITVLMVKIASGKENTQ